MQNGNGAGRDVARNVCNFTPMGNEEELASSIAQRWDTGFYPQTISISLYGRTCFGTSR